ILSYHIYPRHLVLLSFPTRRSSDLVVHPIRRDVGVSLKVDNVPAPLGLKCEIDHALQNPVCVQLQNDWQFAMQTLRPTSLYQQRSEEHTSELQSLAYLVCRLLLEKK